MFSFVQPFYLIFIPIAILIIIFISRKKTVNNKFFKYSTIVLRSIILSCIILSMAGLQINKITDITTTVFAVDVSASIENKQKEILDFINNSIKDKRDKDYTALISFGEDAIIEKDASKEKITYNINSNINNEFTNISNALNFSRSLFKNNSNKRIVLFSDGQENIDSALKTAKALKGQNISVDTYYVKNNLTNEVQITKLDVPKYINKNSNYSINVIIDSLIDTYTDITVYKQDKIIYKKNLKIKQGENRFVINDKANIEGGIIYKCEITPSIDTIKENNTAYSYSYVESKAKVLLIQNNNSGDEIKNILENSEVDLEIVSAENISDDINYINSYDEIIISNCPIESFSENFLKNLEIYVRDLGGGLFVTGGENSYGLGNYYKTILEDILPVDMDLSTDIDLGLVIIIDRSGSMQSSSYGVSKLELAKEAVIRSVDILKDEDSIGIISFDDKFYWTSEFSKVKGNNENIKNKISEITSGGGTDILSALKEASEKLSESDSKLKHIILLTDGNSSQAGYGGITSYINDNNITLSTVAVGKDADQNFLSTMSKRCNGRYYYTDEFTDLPKIFVDETFKAGKEFINNRSFYPSPDVSSQILKNINQIPQLDGYVSTTLKDRANKILSSDTGEPILASWQYGLGKSSAWTSDMQNWTNDWLNSDEGVQIFKNITAWTLRNQIPSDMSIVAERNGDTSDIIITTNEKSDIKAIKGNIIGNDINLNASFEMTSPNTFKTNVPISEEGAYILNLELEKDNKEDNFLTATGINIPYSDEYNIKKFESGEILLKQISEITNGNPIQDNDNIFSSLNSEIYTKKDLSDLLLILSIFLLLADIFFRKFDFILFEIENKIKNLFQKRKNNDKNFSKDFKIKSNYDNVINRKNKKTKKTAKNEGKNSKNIDKDSKAKTSNILASAKKKRTGR